MPETESYLPETDAAASELPAEATADAAAGDGSDSPGDGQPVLSLEELQAENVKLRSDRARATAEAQRRYNESLQERELRVRAEMNIAANQAVQQQLAQQTQRPPISDRELAKAEREAFIAGDDDALANIRAEQSRRSIAVARQQLSGDVAQAATTTKRFQTVDSLLRANPDLVNGDSRLFKTVDSIYKKMTANAEVVYDQINYKGTVISPTFLSAALEAGLAQLGITTRQAAHNEAADIDTTTERTKPVKPGSTSHIPNPDRLVAPFEKVVIDQRKRKDPTYTTEKYLKATLTQGELKERIRQGRPVLPAGVGGQ